MKLDLVRQLIDDVIRLCQIFAYLKSKQTNPRSSHKLNLFVFLQSEFLYKRRVLIRNPFRN